MSILFDDARVSTHSTGRWTTGLWLSVAAHAVVVVVLIVVPIGASEEPAAPSMHSRMVFVLPATAALKLPPVPLVAPRVPRPAPPPPVRELARTEEPKVLPVAPVVVKAIEPPPPVTAAPERPIETPVVQRPPETGLFERTQSARTSQAAAAVTTGGFGSTTASPRDAAIGTVKTGGFGSTAASPRDAVSGSVKTGGFGSEAPATRRAAQGEVQTVGFERATAPVPSSEAPVTKAADRPVEIVFKPTPEYTDEARSARIEGTVSLELEFTATGEVRVLRVVRGLGHGLDEAAQRAALRIRFKPAQSDGRPVDSRATVHITFRLS
jgi:TonB family protein